MTRSEAAFYDLAELVVRDMNQRASAAIEHVEGQTKRLNALLTPRKPLTMNERRALVARWTEDQ